MHLGKNNPKYSYTLNKTILNETFSEKDLEARKMSGLIIRTISYKSKEVMIPLFKSLIRPILEYGNPVWCPYLRKNIDLVESVQRHYTKCIVGFKNFSYVDRMKSLKIPSLEFRRLRGDLIEAYKICNNIYDPLTTSNLFVFNSYNRTRSNNCLKLTKCSTKRSQFQHFFTNRIINLWNDLPEHVARAKSTNCFKNSIDQIFKEYMFSTHLQLNYQH